MKNEINVGHYRVSVDTTGNEDNMIEKIKALWIKYEEIIAYLIVGGLTTVVSWAAKFLANFLLLMERRVFICRYWYLDPISAIAEQFGFSQSKVKMILHRQRQKLQSILEREAFL